MCVRGEMFYLINRLKFVKQNATENYFLVSCCFMRVFKEQIKFISQGITVPAICNKIVVQYQ